MMRVRNVRSRACLLGAALVGGLAVTASANTIVPRDSYGGTSGGEFRITTYDGNYATPGANVRDPAGSLFQTFCVEKDEYISFGNSYQWDLNTQAVNGGVGGPSPDPLDPRTAYLFTQFWNGTLSSYNYTNASLRPGDADELQEAIWYIEQEITGANGQAATWVTEATNAVAGAWGNTLGNVRVLNLFTTNTPRTEHQDLLVVVPTPQAALSGMALLTGLGVAHYLRRRAETEEDDD
jgi:hypothetical protein